ncbi:MAG: hypothetical protein EOO12_08795 [Chitinophagaceae bacterium]|nr:MAG: hypothetical protein EOO12_08795 [Chitinophagaceae bacterium]
MRLQEERYPSGVLCSIRRLENDVPANGWSVSEYFENGQLARAECWSHGLLIELKTFEEDGTQRAHRIYNHRLKQLVDRPVLKPYERPNVVVGFGHMGFYFQHLPAIAAYIGAPYNEDELEAAYQRWMDRPRPEREEGSEWEPETERWGIAGPSLRFSLWFEEGEMLYQWQLWAPDEAAYWKARAFLESLPR